MIGVSVFNPWAVEVVTVITVEGVAPSPDTIVDKLIDNSIIDNSFDKSSITIDCFSNSRKGDVSTNLLLVLKRHIIDSSFNLIEHITNNIQKIYYISKVNTANKGFINVIINDDYLIEILGNALSLDSSYGENSLGKNQKINIEFVSANPTGPIHIAHIRGAVIGDVLSNMFKKIGIID